MVNKISKNPATKLKKIQRTTLILFLSLPLILALVAYPGMESWLMTSISVLSVFLILGAGVMMVLPVFMDSEGEQEEQKEDEEEEMFP